jgi:glycosyltransferase involved in cell wall biosynthesis
VIPTLNEEENLPIILRDLSRSYELIVVDGHSGDDTINVARRARPDTRVLVQKGSGKGDALADGFSAASGDVIVMFDADGSADAAEIPRARTRTACKRRAACPRPTR